MSSQQWSQPNDTKSSESGKVLQIFPTLLWECQVFIISTQPIIGCRVPLKKGCDFGDSLIQELFPEKDDNWGFSAIRVTNSSTEQKSGQHITASITAYHFSLPATQHPLTFSNGHYHKVDVPQCKRKWKFAQVERLNISSWSLAYFFLLLHIEIYSLDWFLFNLHFTFKSLIIKVIDTIYWNSSLC